jgi:hypothetical protein
MNTRLHLRCVTRGHLLATQGRYVELGWKINQPISANARLINISKLLRNNGSDAGASTRSNVI